MTFRSNNSSLSAARFIPFLFILIAVFSCKKDDPVTPGGGDPTTAYQQYGTPFANVPANDDIILYEVNLRAFSTAGNLQGVTNRLDELKKLGVNVIWLMPVHPIGSINSVNSPYSVKDYKAVSTEYGSLADVRKLTDEAHSRDMAVIMDWVANHTAWDHAWIANKSWYTQNAAGEIIHPAGTNWMDVADLNFNNTDMRKAMIDAMKYWALEANVDGYRCDYADGVPFDFWKQAIDSLEAIPGRDLVLLAEGSRGDHYQAGFDLTYGWDFYGTIKNVFNGQSTGQLFTTHSNEYSNIPAGKHKLRFTTNHDESAWDQTPMVLFKGKEGALVASVITVFMGGVPMIYTGQEVGRMQTVPFFTKSPINWNDNPDMLLAYQSVMQFYSQSAAAKSGALSHYPSTDVVCFEKTRNNEKVLVIVNARGNSLNYSLPAGLQNTAWTDALTGASVSLGTALQLGKYGYFILKK